MLWNGCGRPPGPFPFLNRHSYFIVCTVLYLQCHISNEGLLSSWTLEGMVYFSTYANLLYSTSDFRQIRYTHILPTSMWFYSCDYGPSNDTKINSWRRSDIAVCRKVSRSEVQ